MKSRKAFKGLSRTFIAIIVVVIVVIGIAVGVLLGNHPSSNNISTTTTSSSIISTTTLSSTSSSTSPPNSVSIPSSITVEEAATPVSVDPASSYDIAGGEIIQNVYQTLVFYNGTNTSSFIGVLAENWTVENNGTTYIFHLWPFITFSNGNPLNATDVWFSIYRTMLINLGISIYTSQALAVNNGLGFVGKLPNGKYGTIMLPNGILQALEYAGYNFSSNKTIAMEQAAYDLAYILSHFNVSNTTIQKVMSYPHQAVVVIDPYTVEFNLDYPYSAFLAALSTSTGAIVNPVFVDENGGVQIDTSNTYLSTHALGSGPYILETPIGGSYVVLNASPNYWASKVPTKDLNPMLETPKIKTIIIDYQTNEAVRILDLQQEKAQISQIDVINLQELIGSSGVQQLQNLVNGKTFPTTYTSGNVTIYIWGPSAQIDFLAIDAYQYPFNITAVRLAISHAINPVQIQQQVYKGFAINYVGPLDPSLPYYNSSIIGYTYNPSLSIQLLEEAGFKLTLPNGTTVNPNGKPFPTITLTYQTGSTALQDEALLVQQQLAQIGITVQLNPESAVTIVESYLNPPNSSAYPAFQLAGNFPPVLSPIDPAIYLLSQARLHHGNPAFVDNSTINQLIVEAVRTNNPQQLQHIYNEITLLTLAQAQYVWLDDFLAYTVASSSIHGFWYSPGLDGLFYADLY
ncbi:ABC transporter substrate-binding protein [Saccharolobus solfataricus]|jgi:ABC-type dipeptide transport system, periplasmic component|uniref:ABC transporter substrate-binding protein n=6 Tax=Saccharolobus TaxID=2100760 RepID=A0A0E3GT33_SACSO|nr:MULTISPECIES: ABC transporter substrate-binding protein [Sulfolobaceae]ACP36517.1 extracellular solute-binding protein family 5 [Sulfolobus islandicus L.S.2.15]ADB88311.1 extracellular solute-binding protein, family 5 [Sulfolobus islandicus L.D.8.5]ADX83672.1 extracellular solute-binding protein family 5 [Sulfolobus islandicus HVE10/4]AGJ63678.1 ABC-type dipeptide transport system, periplasmiccomponent [Sulfolobus islandicus LAL14/1]AKA73121.1 ABC transporter substrate-binding protein [Sacc